MIMDTIQVLIDTWWNVNRMIYKLLFCQEIVLIDTWWNVNFNILLLFLALYLF